MPHSLVPRLLLQTVITVLLGLATTATSFAAEPDIDFARQVQPILARKCYACHGPGTQEGSLRLDHAEGALKALESGEVGIVPGKPDASEVLRRVSSTDDSERMPPKGKPLSASEVSILKSWIEQGAKWKSHWAFEPPVRHEPPKVQQSDWVKNPIDAFILSKLEDTGLSPNPPADRRALIRRVTYDLTGLPPSPEEVEAFVNDKDPQAYEKLVDKLLASEHYGERWARHWLDVVRYAETNSFERDGPKPHAWRFRDYVIRSFNDDKPYDQFIREQIAGDEFEKPTGDSLIATGFYRLGLWDDEPADREQAKFDSLDDLATTTAQGILALTINCARCHDHKIDPITQKDYYSLIAFFHNVTPMSNGGPQIEQPIFENDAARQAFEAETVRLRNRRDELQGQVTALEKEFSELLQKASKEVEAPSDMEDVTYRFYRDSWQKLPNFDELKPETIDKLPGNRFDISPATRPDYFGFVFTGVLKVPADGDYTFTLDGDDGVRLVIDGEEIIRYDGIHGEGNPRQAKIHLKQGRRDIRVDYFQGAFGKGLTLFWTGADGKVRWLSETDGSSGNRRQRNVDSLKKKDFNQLLSQNGERLLGKERYEQFVKLRADLSRAGQQQPTADFALCVSERGKQAPETFVLGRGSHVAPGDKVEPSFPGVLGGGVAQAVETSANSSGRRTALANWLTSKENRLTARVMANRVWQHHFGRGIVRSPNNFGLLGDSPTHPELLDWLATEFMRLDWHLKPLHKLILMSNTYQQSSQGNPAALAKDPANNLFWRYNMRRLSAEELRDSLHAINGSLNPKMYGPSTYPKISAEVLAGQSVPGKGWGKSSAEESARRSIYIHVKRSLVEPLLAAFDFPDTDTTCEARFMTVQPGQSLALLNGEFIKEQGQVFADRVAREAGADTDKRVRRALELALGRPATDAEIARGLRLIETLQKNDKQSVETAFRNFCVYVYNLNEFIFLD